MGADFFVISLIMCYSDINPKNNNIYFISEKFGRSYYAMRCVASKNGKFKCITGFIIAPRLRSKYINTLGDYIC